LRQGPTGTGSASGALSQRIESSQVPQPQQPQHDRHHHPPLLHHSPSSGNSSNGGPLSRQLSWSRSNVGGADSVPGNVGESIAQFFPKRIIVPKLLRQVWFQRTMGVAALTAFIVVGIATSQITPLPHLRVAMIGNSMMYYNDFPRFLEAISDGRVEQDSCLHGDASLHSILVTGSGTYKVWRTGVAQIRNASIELYHKNYCDEEEEEGEREECEKEGENSYNPKYDFTRLYDYGACTVPQLLFGYDKSLDQKMDGWSFEKSYQSHGDDFFDDDDYYTFDTDDGWNAYSFDSFMDGANPCLMDPNYYIYRNYLYWGGVYSPYEDDDSSKQFDRHYLYPTAPQWDYIILNDNTRSPAQTHSRQDSLNILEQQYLLWFQETGSIPILMFTYAYDTPYRDMSGMIDIPTFTSLTYEGYRQYAELLEKRLPETQKPRIAPVGWAFLTVWEESYEFWNSKLFHVDRIHASPHGSFLQGCVVYCTLFGKLPPRKTALDNLESLWNDARRMGPVKHRRLPLPTRQEATYLYHVAERVCLLGHVPKSFVFYENGESTSYIATDDTYKRDDFY
jgi:hypothetical protein